MLFSPLRGGAYRQVLLSQIPAFMASGWLELGSAGGQRDIYSVLMWHCECGEIDSTPALEESKPDASPDRQPHRTLDL